MKLFTSWHQTSLWLYVPVMCLWAHICPIPRGRIFFSFSHSSFTDRQASRFLLPSVCSSRGGGNQDDCWSFAIVTLAEKRTNTFLLYHTDICGTHLSRSGGSALIITVQMHLIVPETCSVCSVAKHDRVKGARLFVPVTLTRLYTHYITHAAVILRSAVGFIAPSEKWQTGKKNF